VNSLLDIEDTLLRKVKMKELLEGEKFTILFRLQLIRCHIAEHEDDVLIEELSHDGHRSEAIACCLILEESLTSGEEANEIGMLEQLFKTRIHIAGDLAT